MPASGGAARLAVLIVAALAAGVGGCIASPTPVPSAAISSTATSGSASTSRPSAEPSASPSAAPSPSATPNPTGALALTCPGTNHTPGAAAGHTTRGTSANWSGYVAVAKKTGVTCVQASWIEPGITCPRTGHQAVAIWIGIDGFSSRVLGVPSTSSLVQIGTQADCRDGLAAHGAWREVLPAQQEEVPIGGEVRPGDHISARILYTGGHFLMTLVDIEGALAFSLTTVAPGAPRRTAEWIVEAPATNCPDTCRPVALPKFSAITLIAADATISGQRAAISDDHWTNVRLAIVRSGVVRTKTSGLSAGGTSFKVTWGHA